MSKYHMFSRCEDGLTVDTFENRDDLLEHLGEIERYELSFKFLDCVPYDLSYFPENSMVIIKGDVVKPIPVDVVKGFEIE